MGGLGLLLGFVAEPRLRGDDLLGGGQMQAELAGERVPVATRPGRAAERLLCGGELVGGVMPEVNIRERCGRHRLANLMVTQVRQRITQQVHGHRGRKTNDNWAYRRLLLRGARHLSDSQWRRLKRLFATDDPTGEIQAAWAGKECLRQLLDALPTVDGPLVTDPRRNPTPAPRAAAPALRPYEIRVRLDRFYALAAHADVPELERLAATVETWWPAIDAYLALRVTNARTEGYNRKIKQIKRVSCGFRNHNSYQRRIMLNNAATAA